MPVCLIVTSTRDTHLIPLAAQFAQAAETELVILEPVRRRGQRELVPAEDDDPNATVSVSVVDEALIRFDKLRQEAVQSHGQDGTVSETQADDSDPPAENALPPIGVAFQRLFDERLDTAVLETIHSINVSLLLLPCHQPTKGGSVDTAMERQLFARADCDTMYLRVPEQPMELCRNILVPAVRSEHANVALRRASAVARQYRGTMTALFIEARVDDVSQLVGRRELDRVVQRALGSNRDRVDERVVLADDFQSGVRQAVLPDQQLVLMGASIRRKTHRQLFGLLESKEGDGPAPVVGAVRAAIPFASRLRQMIASLLQDRVPQLGREQRVSLVERVQSSSQWDFDFTVLICLSTLIAALGLVLNSGAVVIGAMLVAPLMTPLVGAGLALVQGNLLLAKTAARSVLRGFLLAFAIGYVLGLLIGVSLTSEMVARTAPSAIDLVVAFVSGLAAAYAMGRPNLTSALPGVAIAAALVPPIATAGMCAAIGEWGMAVGALLLFLTNIVAIVLATAVSLWAVGIRDTHQHGGVQLWSKRAVVVLSVLVICLAVFESWPQLPRGLQDEMQVAAEAASAEIQDLKRQPRTMPPRLLVKINSESHDQTRLAQELLTIAEKHFPQGAELELDVRLIRRTKSPVE